MKIYEETEDGDIYFAAPICEWLEGHGWEKDGYESWKKYFSDCVVEIDDLDTDETFNITFTSYHDTDSDGFSIPSMGDAQKDLAALKEEINRVKESKE